MKLVTFAHDMAPHVEGEQRLVPDDVAISLGDEGALSAAEDWPAGSAAAQQAKTGVDMGAIARRARPAPPRPRSGRDSRKVG